MVTPRLLAASLLVALLLAGCGGDDADEPARTTTSTTSTSFPAIPTGTPRLERVFLSLPTGFEYRDQGPDAAQRFRDFLTGPSHEGILDGRARLLFRGEEQVGTQLAYELTETADATALLAGFATAVRSTPTERIIGGRTVTILEQPDGSTVAAHLGERFLLVVQLERARDVVPVITAVLHALG